MNGTVHRIVIGVYSSLLTPAKILSNFRAHMADLGWRTIYYHDNGPGDEYLSAYHLEEQMQDYRAFSFASGAEKIIAIDITAKDKLGLYAHEMGHICLGHDLFAPSPYEEVEADEFSAELIRVIKAGQTSISEQIEKSRCGSSTFESHRRANVTILF